MDNLTKLTAAGTGQIPDIGRAGAGPDIQSDNPAGYPACELTVHHYCCTQGIDSDQNIGQIWFRVLLVPASTRLWCYRCGVKKIRIFYRAMHVVQSAVLLS